MTKETELMTLTRFWQVCESIPGPAAVRATWKYHLQEEYDVAKVLLRPRNELAQSYPCPREEGCGFPHEVFKLEGNEFIAADRRKPKPCGGLRLSREDLLILEPDLVKIVQPIADLLGFSAGATPIENLHSTYEIGLYSRNYGFHVPVYLTIQLESMQFQKAVIALSTRCSGPFILIAPTAEMLGSLETQVLSSKKALFLRLCDIIGIDSNGNIKIQEGFQEAVDSLGNMEVKDLYTQKDASTLPPGSSFEVMENYRIIHYQGRSFCLAQMQADVIRILHKAWLAGKPDVTLKTIQVESENTPTWMSNLFRKSDERSILIRQVKKGIYRLNIPDEPDT